MSNELQNSTRTVYGNEIQSAHNLGVQYVPAENTTLNERFNVHANTNIASNARHSLIYYTIGLGGHTMQIGADNIPFTSPIKHDPRDAGLFKHMPFVTRPVNDDFPVDHPDREVYGLRSLISVNLPGGGTENRWGYFGKRIDKSAVTIRTSTVRVVGENETATPFVPELANLFPTAPNTGGSGSSNTTGDYMSTSAVLTIPFTTKDVNYLKEVARLLYNNEELALISEVGLLAGVRQSVNKISVGGSQTTELYNEILEATIVNHVPCYYPARNANSGFDLQLELGMTEPLAVYSNA